MNETLQIEILDEIGGWGFTFADLVAKAKGFKGKKIRVPVNSYGGEVLQALAIYNFLKGHSAEVETHIPAFAMSAGTIVAAAGDRVTMAENGFYMIHNPWSVAVGESSDMNHVADILDKMKAEMVEIYYQKTKKKMGKKEIARMMDDETWLTAKEALNLGFVDELTPGAKIEACVDPQAFRNYTRVPDEVKAILTPQIQNDMNLIEKIKAFFFGAETATDTQVEDLLTQHGSLGNFRDSIKAEIETELNTVHDAQLFALNSKLAEATHNLEAATAQNAEQATKVTALEAQVATLLAEVESLKATPPVTHTKGAAGEEAQDEPKHSEFTIRAAQRIGTNKKGLPAW